MATMKAFTGLTWRSQFTRRSHLRTAHLMRFAAVVVFFLMAAGLRAQVCAPNDSFQSCIGKLYVQVCAAPDCSNDWRVQWKMLDAYCAVVPGGTAPCPEFRLYPAELLTLTHTTGRWTPDARIEKRVDKDVNGAPTVFVTRKDHLIVSVDRTNALLFSVVEEAATKENIAQLADLQALASSIGGVLAMRVAAIAGQGGNDLKSVLKPLDDISGPASTLLCLVDRSAEENRRIIAFLQAVEMGSNGSYGLTVPSCNGTPFDVASVTTIVPTVENNRGGLACDAATKLAAVFSNTDPAKYTALEADFVAATDLAACSWLTVAPAGGRTPRALILNDLNDLRDRASDFANAPDEAAAAVAKKAFLREQSGRAAQAATLSTGASQIADLRKNVPDLLGKVPELIKAIGDVKTFQQRLIRNSLPNAAADNSIATGEVVTFLVVPGTPDRVTWDEVQTRPFKVAKSSPYADKISLSRPSELSSKYKLTTSSSRNWDIGISLVTTDVVDPKFGAVTKPVATTGFAQDDEPEEPAPPKQIAQVGESTRAGELAMFVHLGIVGMLNPDASPLTRRIGVEIGAALSTDKPALFAGVSLPLTRYFRLGGGYTVQRVTALDGQSIGQDVTADTDIKTRQNFDDGYYVSLSISLGSISFFTKPK
jgi:hypothetical protein